MKTITLKTRTFKITSLLPGTLALTLLLACKPDQNAPAQADKPTTPAAASGAVRYESQPGGSKVKIEGTSSIHDWKMESPVIGGFLEADAGFPESALKGGAAAKPKVEATIPVRSLRSDNKRMDEIYQEHMEQPKFTKMEYKLTELKPKGDAPKNGKCEFDAVGVLTVHGKAKDLTMPVTIEKLDAKQIKVVGSTSLKMTDFEIKPVNPQIGPVQITTGDEVKVSFEWTAAQK